MKNKESIQGVIINGSLTLICLACAFFVDAAFLLFAGMFGFFALAAFFDTGGYDPD